MDASIFSTVAEKPIVGGMIGNSLNTIIQNSTVQDTIVSGAYVGGIAGRSENSKMLNIYTTGQLKGIPILCWCCSNSTRTRSGIGRLR